MSRYYIAGPMTGIPEFNFPAFDAEASILRRDGHTVISPAEMDRADGFNERGCTGFEVLSDGQRQKFARNDIAALLEVTAVVLLPGWQNSTGATNEVKVASWLGLPCFEVDTTKEFGVDYDRYTYVKTAELWSSVKKDEVDINPIDLDVLLADAEEERECEAAPARTVRADLLAGASALVNGDRNVQYGDPRQDFQRTATFWSAYLGQEDLIAPYDVAAMMSLLKLSRIRWSPTKEDSWMDLAGYAACGWDCVADQAKWDAQAKEMFDAIEATGVDMESILL